MIKFLQIVVILALLLGLAACGSSRPDARKAANEFFQKIGESRFETAYDNTAFAFQAQTSFKNFQATAKELGLTAGTVTCNWTQEETKEREVKLQGDVKAEVGTAVPVIVTMVKERGDWRVFSLHIPNQTEKREEDRFTLLGKGGSFTSSANQEVPSLKLIQELVLKSLMMFNDAIARQSFTQFYSKVSMAWQNQLTEGQLKRAFQPFIDAKVDIHEIRNLSPVFTTPLQIGSDGVLIVKGYYDTKPYRTTFMLRFIYELPYWKLYGVEVQLEN